MHATGHVPARNRKAPVSTRQLNSRLRPAEQIDPFTEDELRGALILAGRRFLKLNFGRRDQSPRFRGSSQARSVTFVRYPGWVRNLTQAKGLRISRPRMVRPCCRSSVRR